MWIWGFGNRKWYKSLESRVEEEWLDKTFVSHMISKTTYSHLWTLSISIVEKYKQAIRNYKWKEISLVTVKVNVLSHKWLHWQLSIYFYIMVCTHMCQVKVNVLTYEYIDLRIVTWKIVLQFPYYSSFQQCAVQVK